MNLLVAMAIVLLMIAGARIANGMSTSGLPAVITFVGTMILLTMFYLFDKLETLLRSLSTSMGG